MRGNRIAIVTDRPEDLVEVHPPAVPGTDQDGAPVVFRNR